MVRINVDLSKAQRKLSDASVQRGKFAAANQMLADMNPFVPKDEGIARMTGHVYDGGNEITWDTPYIKKLFYMYMFNYTTPGTGPRWDLKAKGMFMSDWIKIFNKGADWN